ncbi:MAG: hypothetical protein ACQEQ4_01590 [Fibrobacterota bacterium]
MRLTSVLLPGFLCIWFIFTACSSKQGEFVRPRLSDLSDTTDMCLYMDRVCREAEEFQEEFRAIEDDKKRNDLSPVMESRIYHCERLVTKCMESLE